MPTEYLVLYIRENGIRTKIGLGISVSKKVGNSVVRHHLTRLDSERAIDLQEEHFQMWI